MISHHAKKENCCINADEVEVTSQCSTLHLVDLKRVRRKTIGEWQFQQGGICWDTCLFSIYVWIRIKINGESNQTNHTQHQYLTCKKPP